MIVRQLIPGKSGEPVKIAGDCPVQQLRYTIGLFIWITRTHDLPVNFKTVDGRNPATFDTVLQKCEVKLLEFFCCQNGAIGEIVDVLQVDTTNQYYLKSD
jgi:hypothetical protein